MQGRGTPALLAAALLAALAPIASRAESFVGANLGQASYGSEACFGPGSCDKTGSAWSVRAGYALPFVSVEARYFDLGRARAEQHFDLVSGGTTTPLTIGGEVKASGLGAGVQAAVPVLPFFAVTALAGASRVRARMSISGATLSTGGTTVTQPGFTGTRTSTQPYYGLGLRFTFAPGFDASLDAQRYRADLGGGKADIDFYGVGLTYRY